MQFERGAEKIVPDGDLGPCQYPRTYRGRSGRETNPYIALMRDAHEPTFSSTGPAGNPKALMDEDQVDGWFK